MSEKKMRIKIGVFSYLLAMEEDHSILIDSIDELENNQLKHDLKIFLIVLLVYHIVDFDLI